MDFVPASGCTALYFNLSSKVGEPMKKQSIQLLLVTLFLVVVAAVPTGAQTGKRLLDKETFMDMESVGTPAISPDGKRVVFSRTWVDKMKDQYRSNLWIADIDGSRTRELTN